jgi:hypothetical protein
LRWCIEHPDALTWPAGADYGAETTTMRRALLEGKPPGREEAQHRAFELIEREPATKPGWWRFEGVSMIDCLLATDRLVVTVEGKRTEPLSPATDWYPKRTQLARNLEAARQLAHGRRFATILITEEPIEEGRIETVGASLDAAVPHLSDGERAELQAAYLGNITWA